MKVSVKKTIIVLLDVLLAVYLGFAVTSFNNPDETMKACSNVSIQIDDETTNGFLSAKEIKNILEQKKLYPYEKPMAAINPRSIEEALKSTSFVNTSQCYKTKDGHVVINITQRLPIVRIKNNKGQDFYVDDQGGVMPNSKYTSDLIIATGNVNEWFAKNYISHLTKALMENPLWRNQIEQINVLSDLDERPKLVSDFINKKLTRLEKFYKYGLSQAGWNKYSYINLEFDNQIICKKRVHRERINQNNNIVNQ